MLVLVLVAACQKERAPAEVHRERIGALVEKHRAKLAPQLKALQAVQAAAKARPALQPIAAPPPAEGVVSFDEEGDGLAGPELDPAKQAGCRLSNRFQGIFRALSGDLGTWRNPSEPPRPDYLAGYERGQEQAASATLALVCRTLEASEPLVNYRSRTYAGGGFSGECRLFRIAGAQYLGGVAVTARLEVRERQMTTGMAANMTERVNQALHAALPTAAKSWYECRWPHRPPQ